MKPVYYIPPLYLIMMFSIVFIFGCSSTKESTHRKNNLPEKYSNLSPVRKQVISESKNWLGVRYKYKGDNKNGVDCSGFVRSVFERVGLTLPRSSKDMYLVGTIIRKIDLLPGDLVYFKNTAGRGITHVGISLGEDWFIHASTTKGVIESSLNEDYYRRHFAGARRILE